MKNNKGLFILIKYIKKIYEITKKDSNKNDEGLQVQASFEPNLKSTSKITSINYPFESSFYRYIFFKERIKKLFRIEKLWPKNKDQVKNSNKKISEEINFKIIDNITPVVLPSLKVDPIKKVLQAPLKPNFEGKQKSFIINFLNILLPLNFYIDNGKAASNL